MKNKTTVRYNFTISVMATLKERSKSVKKDKIRNPVHCFRELNGVSILENSLEVSQNVKYRVTIWPNITTLKSLSKKNENICPHKNLYMKVHISIIYNSWRWNNAMSITNKWIQNKVIYCYNEILVTTLKKMRYW